MLKLVGFVLLAYVALQLARILGFERFKREGPILRGGFRSPFRRGKQDRGRKQDNIVDADFRDVEEE